ncbi:MAG: putative CXXCH cytochrome family protein [Candidatus Promineifilaceae bacterium]|jgi:predicted CXXCH cytochrome family protein
MRPKTALIIVGSLILAIIAGTLFVKRAPSTQTGADFTFGGPTESPALEADSCVACHAAEVEKWRGSQHANAMRTLRPEDAETFQNAAPLPHGPFTTTPTLGTAGPQFTQSNNDGSEHVYTPVGAIAIAPLLQYVVPFPGGRLQAFDAAYNVHTQAWFHVFGDDVRTADDWGFWANRSLNWNARCADCHMTHFEKNYDAATDSYASTWDHMGISCSACHGDMKAHAAAPSRADLRQNTNPQTLKQRVAVCADCHSRREDLTGHFRPGDAYDDHFRLALLTDAGSLYYPDGQIRDEVFEYTSFASSRMHDKGITCFHCHDPHSGQTLLPAKNNQLCMSCHTAPGVDGAPPIVPVEHSHHGATSKGNRCVECHMPETKYMIVDPRRDHGFTIPDPLLTIEHGTPNACNRCHANQTPEWAHNHTQRWYGDRMNRPTRKRAQVIAGAQGGDAAAITELATLTRAESNAVWKASMLSLLNNLNARAATPLLVNALKHKSARVRSVAVRALSPLQEARPALVPYRDDPSRLVRLDAAWATLGSLDRDSKTYQELLDYFEYDIDQPSGALKQAQLALAERRLDDVGPWLDKIVAWDGAAGSHEIKGRMLHAMGRVDEAINALEKAISLSSDNAELHYTVALLYGEAGRSEDALGSLQRTVKHDPGHGRGWYNLGLALAQAGRLNEAVTALNSAERLMAGSSDPAFAAATIHLRLNDKNAARQAALRSLQRDPNHGPTRNLLGSIGP